MQSAQRNVSFEFVEVSDELQCAICLDPFNDPVEVKPCGHLFCKACLGALDRCPECRGNVASRSVPNRIIRNMAASAPVRCKQCGWRGTRSSQASHTACQSEGNNRAPGNRPAVVVAGGGGTGGGSHAAHFAPPVGSYPSTSSSGTYHRSGGAAAAMGSASDFATAASSSANSGSGVLRAGRATHVIAAGEHPAPWTLYDLSQTEYDQAISIFLTFDEDGTGRLNPSELTKLARWLNFAQQPGDIDRMFREMDIDGTGTLSMDEFCTWLKHNKPDPEALYGLPQAEYNCVMMQFHSYDNDQDGRLDVQEFVRLCTHLGYYHPQQAQQIFRLIDLDRNGSIDLHEFLTFRSRGATGPQ